MYVCSQLYAMVGKASPRCIGSCPAPYYLAFPYVVGATQIYTSRSTVRLKDAEHMKYYS